MDYLVSLCKEIVHKRKLILDLAKADFKKRFVGSYFGIVWMFLQPLATVIVYFCVFQLGFKSVPPVDYPYVLWLIPGIMPWFYFSEVLNSGTNCLQEYSYLVKKVVFRVEILPVIKMLSCMMVHGIFAIIMIVVFLPHTAQVQLVTDYLLYVCMFHALAGCDVFHQRYQCIFQRHGADYRNYAAVWDVDGTHYVGTGDTPQCACVADTTVKN